MADLELSLPSSEEIYGGELVAALDRQHPRDLCDVMELVVRGGVTPGIRRAFDTDERELLRTLVRAESDWSLLGIPHLDEVPAIRWRLQNLQEPARKSPGRFRALADALDERLGNAQP